MAFQTASDETITRLITDPSFVNTWLEGEWSASELAGEPASHIPPADIGKVWHATHFALFGSPDRGHDPRAFILSGGTVIEDTDLGPGPARVFRASEVASIAQVLTAVTPARFVADFDLMAFAKVQAKVYPCRWDPVEPELVVELLPEYNLLREFVLATAKKNLGMLAILS